MTYLLDTHTLLWFLQNDKALSKKACQVIEVSDVFVSIASLWEIAIKSSLGKLILPKPFGEIFPKQLHLNDIAVLPIHIEQLALISQLEFIHKDPFDRVIIAQALTNNMTLIGKDSKFAEYHVKMLW